MDQILPVALAQWTIAISANKLEKNIFQEVFLKICLRRQLALSFLGGWDAECGYILPGEFDQESRLSLQLIECDALAVAPTIIFQDQMSMDGGFRQKMIHMTLLPQLMSQRDLESP